MPALLACMPISLNAQSANANLSVTATVVPSTQVIFLPDGSTKIVVANGSESTLAANLSSPRESAASTASAADQKPAPATLPAARAASQGAKGTRRRVKP